MREEGALPPEPEERSADDRGDEASPLVSKRFQVVGRLGEGGMGVVYEAIDRQGGNRVALKTLRDPSAESLERFKREFRALQDIHHPNLVALGELLSEQDQWFFTMELVVGENLLAYVRPRLVAGASEPTVGTDPKTLTEPLAAFVTPRDAGSASGDLVPDDARTLDETRLRAVLAQLADALSALHAVGLVHRDVKPSNVRVTSDGRVVLLDFGIIAQVGSSLEATDRAVGTVSYMAPEQALSGPIGVEADWYSVGVFLYEALTGRLPFRGEGSYVLAQKQWQEPTPPSDLVPTTPRDLERLCMALLRFDPAARAGARDVERVGSRSSAVPSPFDTQSSRGPGTAFVGRSAELRTMQEAYDEVRAGQTVVVLVEGESGVGKSCLVQHFARARARENPRTVLLFGRCYEREAVPFTAFDGVVESLARLLMTLDEAEVLALLPRRVAPLVQVFPVLRRVDAIARLVGVHPVATEPAELRARAFDALRELLRRLAARRPLLVAIDDVQWSDEDSRALLVDVLRPPDAPTMLAILTRRTTPGAPTGPPAPLLDRAEIRPIHLARLPDADAEELATQLLRSAGYDRGIHEAGTIAREAKGHPLFIDLLVRHRAQSTRGASLEEALLSRLDRLDELARRAVDVLAVAGAPIPSDVLVRAAGGGGQLTRRLALLRIEHLVQTTRTERGEVVDVYHDRIRVTLRGRFTTEERTELHERLARALETTAGSDPEMLATHWRGAGDLERALRYTMDAADRAGNTLAFDHAAACTATLSRRVTLRPTCNASSTRSSATRSRTRVVARARPRSSFWPPEERPRPSRSMPAARRRAAPPRRSLRPGARRDPDRARLGRRELAADALRRAPAVLLGSVRHLPSGSPVPGE